MTQGRDLEPEDTFPGASLAYDLAACLRFYSRLPVPRLPGEGDPHRLPDFRTLPRLLPVAGLILALPSALILLVAWGLDLGPFLAGTLAVAAGTLVTGALHEDGLADVADGFGGGTTRERRIEIMRDSRIGAYGGVALVLTLALRIGAFATLLDRTGAMAAMALLLAASLSRSAALAPMVLLGPARPGGAGASVGVPDRRTHRNRRVSYPRLRRDWLDRRLVRPRDGADARPGAGSIPQPHRPGPRQDRRPDRRRHRSLPAGGGDRGASRPRGDGPALTMALWRLIATHA